MIVDDSFSRLTTRMIAHDSFWSGFSRKSAGSFKMASKSSSRGSASASEIRFYTQDNNNEKKNIENQESGESVNSQEFEETPPKKMRFTKRSTARWSNDLILRLIDEHVARPYLWDIFSND